MKCCTKMPCPLPHNHFIAAYFLHLYACLTCSSVHASSLHPLLAHHHLCSVLCWCILRFFLFLIYATFLCDSILDCLCTYFWLILYTSLANRLFWVIFGEIDQFDLLQGLNHYCTLQSNIRLKYHGVTVTSYKQWATWTYPKNTRQNI